MAFDVFTSAPNFQHTFHFWRIAQAPHPLGNFIFFNFYALLLTH